MRLKAIAVVTLDNGRQLRNIKVINVKTEYFVILPSRRSMLKDIGERGLDRFFLQDNKGTRPYRVHLLHGKNRAIGALAK